MSDLNMLAVTGGRERSEREWRTLLDAAGFILTRVCPVRGDNLTRALRPLPRKSCLRNSYVHLLRRPRVPMTVREFLPSRPSDK